MFWRKKKQRNDLLERRLFFLEGRVEALQGQIVAHQILFGLVLDALPANERDNLIEGLKYAVGKGVGGQAPWLDRAPWLTEKSEAKRHVYNNAFSALLQDIIERPRKTS